MPVATCDKCNRAYDATRDRYVIYHPDSAAPFRCADCIKEHGPAGSGPTTQQYPDAALRRGPNP